MSSNHHGPPGLPLSALLPSPPSPLPASPPAPPPACALHDGSERNLYPSDPALVASITSFRLAPHTTAIGAKAFMNCKRLTSLEGMADSKIVSIGASAFANSSVSSLVHLPLSLRTVQRFAFSYCPLSSFAGLPAETSCSYDAFAGCAALEAGAAARNFSSVERWLAARALRFTILACVRRAREQEAGGGAESRLLRGLALLDDDVLSVIVPFVGYDAALVGLFGR